MGESSPLQHGSCMWLELPGGSDSASLLQVLPNERLSELVGLEGCNDELWFRLLAREEEANRTTDDRGVSDMDSLDGICCPSG